MRRRPWRVAAAVFLFVALLGSASGVAVGLMGGNQDSGAVVAASPSAGDPAPTTPEDLALDTTDPATSSTTTTDGEDPPDQSSTVPATSPTSSPATAPPVDSTAPPDTVPPQPPDTTTPPDTTMPPGTTAPPPDTTVATITTPPPPDTTPPSITQASGTPGQVWELDEDFLSCPAGTPRVAEISASVSDIGSGVWTVEASWTIGTGSTSVAMTPVGGVYSADFGPFVYLTVADNTAPSIEVIIVARDIANNETKTTVGVVVNSLAKCFG